jgi:prevent-host-death family protein
MRSVGVRELRDNLSEYLRRVREGELLVITDRGQPIGELGPAAAGRNVQRARGLARKGVASWSGGKPKGLLRAPRPRAGTVSDAVIEDRR